jgi:hypothetical protein
VHQGRTEEEKEDRMNTPTVDEAIDNLRRALRAEQTQAIVKHLEAVLGVGSRTNGHAPRREYRRSAAGRARQVAAMKAYWRKRRAQKK